MKNSKVVFHCLLALLLSIPSFVFGQDYDLTTPEGTIDALFKSMYDGDSTLASLVFAEDASLNSVFTTKDGIQKVKAGKIAGFVSAIGTPHEEAWDERVSNLKVQIDDDLAQAWMDYSFFIGDKFSHCGVNAMHLIRKDGIWRIFQIVDTRRKADCN